VGEKRMVRIAEVGRTAASAQLLDDSGEPIAAGEGSGRRQPRRERRGGGERRSAPRKGARDRGRRAPADGEDAQARREAGLRESPTTVDSEPEQEPVALESARKGTDESGADDIQSKPRRRGRRGGRRRSAARAKASSK
jgi:hypothetical protein